MVLSTHCFYHFTFPDFPFILRNVQTELSVFQVNVPFEFHRSIIGQKGKDVRELMVRYDVHIVLSPADQQLDIIKVGDMFFIWNNTFRCIY